MRPAWNEVTKRMLVALCALASFVFFLSPAADALPKYAHVIVALFLATWAPGRWLLGLYLVGFGAIVSVRLAVNGGIDIGSVIGFAATVLGTLILRWDWKRINENEPVVVSDGTWSSGHGQVESSRVAGQPVDRDGRRG